MNYLILIIVGITGIVLGSYFARARFSGACDESDDLIAGQSKKKGENLKKVLKLFETKEKVTNNDVEQLLEVSNATAERYLNELERDGKLVQNGKTGIGVFYTLK